jgi:hypothetical protein
MSGQGPNLDRVIHAILESVEGLIWTEVSSQVSEIGKDVAQITRRAEERRSRTIRLDRYQRGWQGRPTFCAVSTQDIRQLLDSRSLEDGNQRKLLGERRLDLGKHLHS